MLDEAEYLEKSSRGVSYEVFCNDPTLTRAFVRSLEVIGEASKQVSSEIRLQYPNIEWRKISGMRDRLIHAYLGIDYGIVWDVITAKIRPLREELRIILSELPK